MKKLLILQLENMKLDLQRKQMHVNRINDYIDAKLNQQRIQTDCIQANTDSQRAMANGMQTLLEKKVKCSKRRSKMTNLYLICFLAKSPTER